MNPLAVKSLRAYAQFSGQVLLCMISDVGRRIWFHSGTGETAVFRARSRGVRRRPLAAN
jgi:hypothetical protein